MQPALWYSDHMRGVSLASLSCPVARTLDVVGERWTLLVLRDAFNGARRFEDFLARLPIARNVLTERLRTLVAHGILDRVPYQDRPTRYEYRLTQAGMELYPVIVGLMQWGNRHRMGEAGTLDLRHKACGHQAEADVRCSGCGEPLTARDVRGSLSRPPSAQADIEADTSPPAPASAPVDEPARR